MSMQGTEKIEWTNHPNKAYMYWVIYKKAGTFIAQYKRPLETSTYFFITLYPVWLH